MRLRTPESVKKKLDSLQNKYHVTIDHGVANYEFSHYEYNEPSFDNHFTSSLDIYVKDFDKDNSIIFYMSITEDKLRDAKKDDWYTDLIWCSWDKRFPSILYIRDYCTN